MRNQSPTISYEKWKIHKISSLNLIENTLSCFSRILMFLLLFNGSWFSFLRPLCAFFPEKRFFLAFFFLPLSSIHSFPRRFLLTWFVFRVHSLKIFTEDQNVEWVDFQITCGELFAFFFAHHFHTLASPRNNFAHYVFIWRFLSF